MYSYSCADQTLDEYPMVSGRRSLPTQKLPVEVSAGAIHDDDDGEMSEEATNTDRGKNMITQPIRTERLHRGPLPLWKRFTLVTALLLSAGAITPITCFASHSHYGKHSSYSHAICEAGNGGDGGISKQGSGGGNGSGGGDCFFSGTKGGPGGTQGAYSKGANGGDVIVKKY